MTKTINDVSFAGSKIRISGAGASFEVADFMDDANPVEFQDTEVSGAGMNFKGQMIRYAKASVITASVTVAPASDSDNNLYVMWKKFRIHDNWEADWENGITLSVTTGKPGCSRTLSNGTMVSGPAGPSSNGEGKMIGRTYTFAFVTAN